MIPKIIHYCWFGGGALPPLALKCIASWRKYLPDYEIREWNESNFDVDSIPYTKVAYSEKKYAFVSDYARFVILNKYGGIYFDTDVEVIRPIDDILSVGAFLGFERDPDKFGEGLVAPGLGMACEANSNLTNYMIELYKTLSFRNENGTLNQNTICKYTTDILLKYGLNREKGIQTVLGFSIYPSEYFAPIHFVTRRLHITKNTRTIHQYMASWTDNGNKTLANYIANFLPESVLILYNRLKHIRSYSIK